MEHKDFEQQEWGQQNKRVEWWGARKYSLLVGRRILLSLSFYRISSDCAREEVGGNTAVFRATGGGTDIKVGAGHVHTLTRMISWQQMMRLSCMWLMPTPTSN